MEENEIEVPIGKTGQSKTNIRTKNLGPCIGFLLSFKYDGKYTAILIHYDHPMKRTNKRGMIGDLIQIMDYFCLKIFDYYPKEKFISGQQHF
jgi:hypothetical protein